MENNISIQFQTYLNEIREAIRKEWEANKYDMTKVHEITFTVGGRFFKVIYTSWGQTSVHCFVNRENGDIYKASGWNAPAKGVRGNIFNERKPLLGREFYVR